MTNFLRSPINYMGGKFRSLKYIVPHFPNDIGTFYDVFGGSGTVMMNTIAENYKYNDAVTPLKELLEYLGITEPSEVIRLVEGLDREYDIQTLEGFNKLREKYNAEKRPEMLYALVNHSFNYLMRFNMKGEYNASSGKGVCKLSESNIEKLKNFYAFNQENSVEYFSGDYRGLLNASDFDKKDFLYFDPPYDISTANYNEKRGFVGWGVNDGIELLNTLSEMDSKGIRWGYSNMLSSKGVVNAELKEWIDKNNFSVYLKEVKYNGVPSTRLDLKQSVEVFVTNFDVKGTNK